MEEIEVLVRLLVKRPVFGLLSIFKAPLPNSYTKPIVITTKKINTIIRP